jgi:phosphatidylinositol alpha-1,6-mannosyltransferase
VAPRSPGARAHDVKSTLRIVRLPSIGDDLALSGIVPLARLLRAGRFDAVLATHWAPGFAAQKAARLAGCATLPVFIAAHGKELMHSPLADVPLAQPVYDRVRRSALRNARGFFPVSTRTAQLLRERGDVPEGRITVAHNGVDATRYAPRDASALKRELAGDAPLMLTVARLITRKGIDTVLQALPAVLVRTPNLVYAIVGDGPDRPRLSALAQSLGVAASVRFRAVSRELVDYYNACDLFVMPAREEPTDIEGFGLVFLEAGACEKPVIGARAGGVPDAIVHGETGLLVPSDDVPALAQAIGTLLDDPARARQLGVAARRRVLQQGLWQHTAATISDTIERAVAASR